MTLSTNDRPRRGPSATVPIIALGMGAIALVAASANASNRRRRPLDDAPLRAARDDKIDGYTVVGKAILIDRPRAALFSFWRDFRNLPHFMKNVHAVEPLDGERWRWTLAAPLGQSIELVTGLVEERPDERLAWRSLEGSAIDSWGVVDFRDAPAGRGTVVDAEIGYRPPAGELGRLVAKLFAAEPNVQGRHELKRFKMLMETGEIATSARRRDEARGEQP